MESSGRLASKQIMSLLQDLCWSILRFNCLRAGHPVLLGERLSHLSEYCAARWLENLSSVCATGLWWSHWEDWRMRRARGIYCSTTILCLKWQSLCHQELLWLRQQAQKVRNEDLVLSMWFYACLGLGLYRERWLNESFIDMIETFKASIKWHWLHNIVIVARPIVSL